MSREQKIAIILDARPNLKNIILIIPDEQLDLIIEEIPKELERELSEAAFI